jgi:uncharacterized membrane protein YfcA
VTPALLGGLLVGFSLGLLGSGGSILTVPVLAYGLGHAERVAIAESLLIVGAIALLGSIQYIRADRVCWKSVLLFGVPGMAGTYLGAVAAAYVSGTIQLVVFGMVMLVAAGLMLRPRKTHLPELQDTGHPVVLIALEGIAVGALTGFVGVGGGFLIVPALIFLRRLPIHYAVGTSLMIIALKSATGFVKYLDVLRVEQLSVHWLTVAVFIGFGALGTLAGRRINRNLNPRALQLAFAAFLVVMSAVILYREGSRLMTGHPAEEARLTLDQDLPRVLKG